MTSIAQSQKAIQLLFCLLEYLLLEASDNMLTV